MLIIGLGNPDKKYAKTRHNAGYMAIDQLEKEKPADFISAKTETPMNLSGKSVKKIIENCKLLDPAGTPRRVAIENLIVIHDDIDIPFGEFKIQKGRGAAGHKGVQSIIDELKTKDFWRIRIGVCPKRGKPENVEKFVLQKFSREELKILKEVIEKIIQELIDFGSQPR